MTGVHPALAVSILLGDICLAANLHDQWFLRRLPGVLMAAWTVALVVEQANVERCAGMRR